MAKQDYLPRRDPALLTWHNNFNTQVAAVAATVGLVQTDIDAVAADNADLKQKLSDVTAAEKQKKAATSAKRATRKTVDGNTRALARRIKAHPAYTEVIGQQLGIIGPEDTTDLSNAKPTLKLISVNPGQVVIGFEKSVSDGVRIVRQRGNETEFSHLADDRESPYYDTGANLVAGQPETRKYRALYLDGDDTIGQWSDILEVTVPV